MTRCPKKLCMDSSILDLYRFANITRIFNNNQVLNVERVISKLQIRPTPFCSLQLYLKHIVDYCVVITVCMKLFVIRKKKSNLLFIWRQKGAGSQRKSIYKNHFCLCLFLCEEHSRLLKGARPTFPLCS